MSLERTYDLIVTQGAYRAYSRLGGDQTRTWSGVTDATIWLARSIHTSNRDRIVNFRDVAQPGIAPGWVKTAVCWPPPPGISLKSHPRRGDSCCVTKTYFFSILIFRGYYYGIKGPKKLKNWGPMSWICSDPIYPRQCQNGHIWPCLKEGIVQEDGRGYYSGQTVIKQPLVCS